MFKVSHDIPMAKTGRTFYYPLAGKSHVISTQMIKKHAAILILKAVRLTQPLTFSTHSSPSSFLLWSGTSSFQAPGLPSPSPSPRAALLCLSVGWGTRTLWWSCSSHWPVNSAAITLSSRGREMATQPHLGL